ncbi:hypothetical protein [Lacrimispora aerotolerans]|jgi:hypothetical protein|nr:hypothetical protein [Lacrimispora aerotolerans]
MKKEVMYISKYFLGGDINPSYFTINRNFWRVPYKKQPVKIDPMG